MVLDKTIKEPLRAHLEQELPHVCDAEAPIMANYILALLEKDMDNEGLKGECINNLEEFLSQETIPFVNQLFVWIKKLKADQANEKQSTLERSDEDDSFRDTNDSERNTGSGRKRRPHQESYDDDNHKRTKNREKRRSHHHRKQDNPISSSVAQQIPSYTPPHDISSSSGPIPFHQRSSFHLESQRRGAPLHHPYPPQHLLSQHPHPQLIHPRPGAGGPHPMMVPPEMVGGYSPQGVRPPHQMQHQQQPQRFPNIHRPPAGQGRGRGGGDMRSGGGGDSYPSSTTVKVSNIPNKLASVSALSFHFEQFGEIVAVNIPPTTGVNGSVAYIQFKKSDAADRAIKSVKAVCGNRFISTGWARRDPRSLHQKDEETSKENEKTKITSVGADGLQQQQQPKNKELEKQQSQQPPSLEPQTHMLLEIGQQRSQMLQKLIKLQKDMISKLATLKDPKEKNEMKLQINALSDNIKKALDKASKQQHVSPASTPVTPSYGEKTNVSESVVTEGSSSEYNEALQNALNRVEQEATAMGLINTQTIVGNEGSAQVWTGKTSRRPYRGRGRSRGGRRGRGARRRGAMVLDNRSTSLHIQDLPSVLQTEKELRAHLRSFGEISSVKIQPGEGTCDVNFVSRHDAEQCFRQGGSGEGETKLSMDWITPSTSTSHSSFISGEISSSANEQGEGKNSIMNTLNEGREAEEVQYVEHQLGLKEQTDHDDFGYEYDDGDIDLEEEEDDDYRSFKR